MKHLLRRDDRGLGAVEFALVAPVLISFVIGVSQVGKLFFANADMKNAVAAGARVAAVWPVPDDATILAAVNDRLVRSEAAANAEPSVFRGTEGGNPYVEIRMSYSVPLEFIFFDMAPVELSERRKVYIQVANGNTTQYVTPVPDPDDPPAPPPPPPPIDPPPTSSGNASSGGGNASSGGGMTTSASSGSSGSSGNGSSGGSASGSSGNTEHGHGDCKKKC